MTYIIDRREERLKDIRAVLADDHGEGYEYCNLTLEQAKWLLVQVEQMLPIIEGLSNNNIGPYHLVDMARSLDMWEERGAGMTTQPSTNPTPTELDAADAGVLTDDVVDRIEATFGFDPVRALAKSHRALAAERDVLRVRVASLEETEAVKTLEAMTTAYHDVGAELARLRWTNAALLEAINAAMEEYPKVSNVLVSGKRLMDVAIDHAPHTTHADDER